LLIEKMSCLLPPMRNLHLGQLEAYARHCWKTAQLKAQHLPGEPLITLSGPTFSHGVIVWVRLICDIHLVPYALAGTFANCEVTCGLVRRQNSSTTPLAFATRPHHSRWATLAADLIRLRRTRRQLFVIAREDTRTPVRVLARSPAGSPAPLIRSRLMQLGNIFVNPYLDIWSNGPSASVPMAWRWWGNSDAQRSNI
jgi:hypothetical protein